MSQFYAFVRDERCSEATWFVYVQTRHGHTVYTCRFGSRHNAEAVATAMNKAWEAEGRLYTRLYEDAA